MCGSIVALGRPTSAAHVRRVLCVWAGCRMRKNWQQNIKTYTDHSKIQFCFVIQSDCHAIVDLHTRQSWLHEKLLKGFKDRGRNVCLLTCPTYSCVAQCTLFCQNGDHDDTILTVYMSYSCQRVCDLKRKNVVSLIYLLSLLCLFIFNEWCLPRKASVLLLCTV